MSIFSRKAKIVPLPPADPNADQPRPPVGPKSDNVPFEGEPDAATSA